METTKEKAETKLTLTENFCEIIDRTPELQSFEVLGILEIRHAEIMSLLEDLRQNVFDGQMSSHGDVNKMLIRLHEIENFRKRLGDSIRNT